MCAGCGVAVVFDFAGRVRAAMRARVRPGEPCWFQFFWTGGGAAGSGIACTVDCYMAAAARRHAAHTAQARTPRAGGGASVYDHVTRMDDLHDVF